MRSVLYEVSQLRGETRPLVIDRSNTNRYRLVIQEKDGSKTAYCFTTPIYNQTSRKMVDLRFHESGNSAVFVGSNGKITVSHEIQMENKSGTCRISLRQKPNGFTEQELRCGNDTLHATTNGIVLEADVRREGRFSALIRLDRSFPSVRANNKYFSVMEEPFRPFVTVSCIGTLNAAGELIAPAKLRYKTITDKKYQLIVTPCHPDGAYVLLEANLYERKLMHDTTVESLHPKSNNAFGTTGFPGTTEAFGEQWLYSRPDLDPIPEFSHRTCRKALLHIPAYRKNSAGLRAFAVAARFCSFGSNWQNKIKSGASLAVSEQSSHYYTVDMTPLISDTETGLFKSSEGLILKSAVKGSGFSAIATGDSFSAPQILEINFQ